ncbi:cellulose binding domain-containing protein [Streptomyces virginiae]|uniref:cellulose binding domain-containing protein n=1 Tax=Streptomyces virginiae TaxID=1961 RepID=UPI00382FB3B2
MALALALMVIATAVGDAAFHFLRDSVFSKNSGDSGPAGLRVRYRTDGPASALTARPWLEVINDSKKTVALSDVTLRYYFTADDASEYAGNCVQSSLGCTNITQKTGASSQPVPQADHYLQIGFTRGAGTLPPGGSTKGIGLQLFRLDHKVLNQSNDRSFNAKATHYAPSKRVTAYLDGTLAWGEEPSGSAPGTGQDSPTPPLAVAAPPTGVMFDRFRYSGPGDPALASNGWSVRTGGGGPGIHDTWSADGVGFPSEATAQGGQALQLRLTTDGTKEGTRQAELQSTTPEFLTGTYAARIYFSDAPTSGADGDHINETFFALSPRDGSSKYSELDYEYMPNGGWGAPGPRLDTTSWRSSTQGDRITRAGRQSLRGWHTVMITALNEKVTYSVDGREVFSHDGAYSPRQPMGIHFSAWLVDLPFAGPRTWDMRVNWVYYQAGQAVPLAAVHQAVEGFYANGTPYVNTLAGHRPGAQGVSSK